MSGRGAGSYRDLIAWQKGMELTEKVYTVTRGFPDEERFGLVAQMRRSAVSIPSNVAEGFGRGQQGEFHRFLGIARGSLFEVQTQAELARRLGWIKGPGLADLRERMRELDAILTALMRAARERRKQAN